MTLRVLPWLLLLACAAARAESVHLAVAANFAAPARELAARFARESGHDAVLSVGSTGKFYAQIRSGAPFDVFLSADDATPARLEKDGAGVRGSRFAYALGRLVLWSPLPGMVDARGDVLRGHSFRRIAIANPRLAPYGAAARDAMRGLGVWQALQPKLVQGENVAQTFQFVSSGNAELGFVALSQVLTGAGAAGSRWEVPRTLHAPLRQDAILLARARENRAAHAFLAFLRGPAAREAIRAAGYEVP